MSFRTGLHGNHGRRTALFHCITMSLLALAATPALAATGASPNGADAGAEPQSETLSQVVVTAQAPSSVNKLGVAVEDVPFSIDVVGKGFMRDTGAGTIQQALTYASGVYAGAFGFDTRADSAKVRGLTPSFYLDGLRNLYGSYNNVRPEVFSLERVEVLKGPSSALYGQAELGGIVNAVSKLPKARRQGELWLQAGSHDRKQLGVDVTGPMSADGKWLYRLVALKRDSGTQVDHVDNDVMLISPSVTWLPTDSTRITLLITSQQNDGAVSAQFLPAQGTLYPAPLGHIDSNTFVGEPGWDRYDTRKNEATLFVDQQLGDQWKLSLTSRYTKSKNETREHWTTIGMVPDADGNIGRTVFMSDYRTRVFNTDLNLTGHFRLGATRHTLAAGVDTQSATWRQDNVSNSPGTPINVYQPVYGNMNYAALDPHDLDDNRLEQTGVYVIDHMTIGHVVVSGALRRDWTTSTLLTVTGPDSSQDDSATTGRIGLMYQFDFGLSPYISYSEAFVPNLGTNTAGATLDPSTGKQKEAGLKYLSPSGHFAAHVAWFDIKKENQVFLDPSSPTTVHQVGATSRGWELSMKANLGGLSLLANYTRLDATNEQSGERLPWVAEKQASTWAMYRWDNGLRIGAGVRYLGDNVGSGGAPTVPSVTLFDAMIGYRIGPWDLSVNARNLADKEYVSWCRGAGFDCGYGARRTVNANVRYHF